MNKFLDVWKSKSLFERVLFVLLVIVNALFLFYWVALSLNYSLHFDDAHFMWKMQEYSIFEYVREMYMTRGGNFVGYGINGIIFTISNWVGDYHLWPIFTYVLGIAMVYGAVKDWGIGFNKWAKLLGIIAFYNIYMLTSIDVAVTMWLCAMTYYLYGPAMLLLVKYLTTNHLNWWQWICLSLIALLLSGSNVSVTPIVLLIMFVIGMQYWWKSNWNIQETWANPLVKRIVFLAIAMLCIYGIMVAAPGNYLRLNGEFDIEQPSNILEFIKACVVCGGMFAYFMAFYLPYHLLTIALGYIVGSNSKFEINLSKRKSILIVLAAFVLYLGISVMPLAYLSNGFQIQRNYTHIAFAYQLTLFIIGYLWGYKRVCNVLVYLGGSIVSLFLIVIMCLNLYQDIPIAKAYNKAHQEREDYLLKQQAAGNTDTLYVAKYPSTHAPDAKFVILSILGKKSEPQAIYYESDTDVEPNEYESHMKHLLHLDFDFVLEE